jgi:hypothetical protein
MDKLYIQKIENHIVEQKSEIFTEVDRVPSALYGVSNIAPYPIISGGIKCSTAMD